MSATRIRRILVPTDFSDGALHAARYALGVAKDLGASLTLLHAYVPPVSPYLPGASFAPTEAVLDEVERSVDRDLERLCGLLATEGVEITSKKVLGTDSETIAKVAKEDGFDLVVMGTHGRTGWRHLILGSIAEEVVRSSEVPVLTVRHPR